MGSHFVEDPPNQDRASPEEALSEQFVDASALLWQVSWQLNDKRGISDNCSGRSVSCDTVVPIKLPELN